MRVIIKKSQAKEPFTFNFIGDDGKSLLRSENYAAKKSCLSGVESVKKNCQRDERYQLSEAKNGKLYFNLKASNGQIIATSALFDSPEARQQAIDSLKAQIGAIAVEESTE